jgi:hypothetical protein
MLDMRQHADVCNPNSFSNRMRSRRFRAFESLVEMLPHPVRMLDVGGTTTFWEQRGWAKRSDVEITLLNTFSQDNTSFNIRSLVGDATDLSEFESASFDVVFSNSVIEHLFTFRNQEKMAKEITRVAKAFWVQTPNFWFPVEPHFLMPGWHWMPRSVRVAMLRRWRCGWLGPCRDAAKAREIVSEVRLMTARELKEMFPGAKLVPEIFAGLVKSWVAISGFSDKYLSELEI